MINLNMQASFNKIQQIKNSSFSLCCNNQNKEELNIFLPIQSHYQKLIMNGEKTLELRRKIPFLNKFRNGEINKVIVYQSGDIKKIIGEFKIDNIIEEPLEKLWNKYCNYHMVKSPTYFFDYFKGLEKGFGIVIKDVVKYDYELNVKEILGNDFSIPQFFRYINKEQYLEIKTKLYERSNK